jgi:Kef-type K+ transport system membrane component KefB
VALNKVVMSSKSRSEISFMVAIAIGLLVGFMIKRVRLGIMLGLLIGGLIFFTGWLRSTRKKS